MSETTAETSTATQDGKQAETTSTATKFEPITSQEDLDRLVGDRVKRERAKFSDYDELKTKAGQLDALTEASQTETEKATSRATKAEGERDTARAEALRLRIAVEHGISIDDADLFLTGTDEKSLRAQAERLSQREADRKKNGPLARREGQTVTQPSDDPMRDAVKQLFGRDA